MFCAAYFGPRPFAPRYFPKTGAASVGGAPPLFIADADFSFTTFADADFSFTTAADADFLEED